MLKLIHSRASVLLVALTLILSIFAFCLLNGSVAWYANNDKVSGRNMNVEVKTKTDDELVKGIDFYSISSVTLSGDNNIYTFNPTAIAENDSKTLGAYSSIVAERQLLIKITLNKDFTRARVDAATETEQYVVDSISSMTQLTNPLSSVVEFYAVNAVTTTDDGAYVVSSADMNSAERFAILTEQSGNTVTDFDKDISLGYISATEHDHAIFVMIDYYEDSIKYVLESVLNSSDQNTSIKLNTDLGFVCDFTLIVDK